MTIASESRPLIIVDGYQKRRFIGYVYNETLHMERQKSVHFFRKHQSWCIDEDVFNDNEDILLFVLHDKETDTKYLATRRDFDRHGKVIEFHGHLPQLSLPLKYWSEFK